jgi:hypothetical protein
MHPTTRRSATADLRGPPDLQRHPFFYAETAMSGGKIRSPHKYFMRKSLSDEVLEAIGTDLIVWKGLGLTPIPEDLLPTVANLLGIPIQILEESLIVPCPPPREKNENTNKES